MRSDPPDSYRRRFGDIAPTQREHTYDLSRLDHACPRRGPSPRHSSQWASPENTYMIEARHTITRSRTSVPSSLIAACAFNTFWERDRHTESIDSLAPNSVRNKILTYEALLRSARCPLACRRLRRSPAAVPRALLDGLDGTCRAYSLCWPPQLAHDPKRLLVYATTMDTFLHEEDALMQPRLPRPSWPLPGDRRSASDVGFPPRAGQVSRSSARAARLRSDTVLSPA